MGSVVQILYAGNQFRVQNAQYYANKMVRSANNVKAGAEASLQEFSRSLGNQIQMENAGKHYNDAMGAISANLNNRVTVNVNKTLQASAALGAIQSNVAAAGVGGSSVQLLDQVTNLQRNIAQQDATDATSRYQSSATRNATTELGEGLSSIDLSSHMAQLDYTQDIAPHKPGGRLGALIGIAVATYFGGPQAGQAAADSTVAAWKAQNGDYGQAASYADRASSGFISGFSQMGQRGGKSWASSAFGYNDGTGPQTSGSAGAQYNFANFSGSSNNSTNISWPGSNGNNSSFYNLGTDSGGSSWSFFGGGGGN